jgi:hypothetical protein
LFNTHCSSRILLINARTRRLRAVSHPLQHRGQGLFELAPPPLWDSDGAPSARLGDEPVAGPVEHLHVELFRRFQFDKAHVGRVAASAIA